MSLDRLKEYGWTISGRDVLFERGWCSKDDNVTFLESDRLSSILRESSGIVYVPASDPDTVKGGMACWQKALLDLMCAPYDDSALDEAVFSFMEPKDAADWVDWMDANAGSWERLEATSPKTRWEEHLRSMAEDYAKDGGTVDSIR